MAKEKERRGSKRSSPDSSREPKAPNIIPSRVWGEGARMLWRGLAFKEKALIVMGIFVPALDQIARLASIGVTMRAISSGIRQHPDLETRLWLGFLILGASAISGLIIMASDRVTKNLKILVTRQVRRIYGRIMAATVMIPFNEREVGINSLVAKERDFITSATSGLIDLIEFIASVSIVVVLLLALTWFNWIVGAILFVSGFIALLILKFRVRTSPAKESLDAQDARKKLTEQFEKIAGSRENIQAAIENYAHNDFDRISMAELEAKSRLQKKITSVMGFGSAILMAVVFFLISAEGAFDEKKMVWLVVFVFGLRMVVTHGKHAMVNWGAVLGEKDNLMTMAKAVVTPLPGVETDPGAGGGDDSTSDETGPGSPPRIVAYSIGGQDGPDITSREPMTVEITVESDREVAEFNWSFAISRMETNSFLITKTSVDDGICWKLPKGRTRFRMESGPVWLPAGTYSAWIGIANGSRTLHLVGSNVDTVPLVVLPDDAAKRSVQTRVAKDVVLFDVEWERDFQTEAVQKPLNVGPTPLNVASE